MAKAHKPTTPQQYIAALPDDRKTVIEQLDALIRKTVPKLKPVIMNGMLGYGPYHYRYESGREGDAAIVGLASQRNHLSLYMCAIFPDGTYVADRYRDRLPKADVGKSCVRFKRLEDIDLAVIRQMVKDAEKLGGMGAI